MSARVLVRTGFGRVVAAVVCLVAAGRAAATTCIADLTPTNGEAMTMLLFPNWQKTYLASFDISDYGIAGNLTVGGLTIQNFGSATSGLNGSKWDIAAVYWRTDCDTAGFYHTMTAQTPNQWTWHWNGVEANPNIGAAIPDCTLRIYADVSATATDGATVQLGVPYDDVTGNPGFTDTTACQAPWADTANPIISTIYYLAKLVDQISAAPGDTLNYTLYYGRPGTAPLTNLVIWDTQPPYTHYVQYSANPAPDPGYDPFGGPPLALQWTIPGPLATSGGPTGMITFQLTVDWGNKESFEPGSGDVAAPENSNLWNSAVATFPNLPANQQVHYSNQARTTVMRYLFWKTGDRDVLFNCSPTQCDEITYSIFVQNLSATKTWWNVSIWDTVPAVLDPWQGGYGMYDPCTGWTMTPTGCAAASPGYKLNPPNTILTWKLDMPPGMTLTLQYKATVRTSALAGNTAFNYASILAQGRTGVVDGTGHSTTPRNFKHLAPIVLRTTYVSYVSYDVSGTFGCSGYYYIAFFPLHPTAAFTLMYLLGTGTCQLQASITNPAPSLPCNAWPGPSCPIGPERRPQLYGSAAGTGCNAQQNFYKLIANSPILWEVSPVTEASDEDSMQYSTTTTLSFLGNTVYTYRRQLVGTAGGASGDYLGIANTGNVQTTAYLFQWDPVNAVWDYDSNSAIDANSQYMTGGTSLAQDGFWRVLSSDTDLICWKGFALQGISDYDNFVTMVPADNGNLTAGAGNSFYAYDGARTGGNAHSNSIMVITNVGPATASVQLWEYHSAQPLLTQNAVPSMLGGSSGGWGFVDARTIPATQISGANTNPYVYGRQACMNKTTSFTDPFALYRLDVISGGPVQVRAGRGGPGRYGGYVLHGLDSGNGPAKAAATFWHTQVGEAGYDIVNFCPSTGMVVQGTNDNGFSATYTTTGPDQPITWGCDVTDLADGCGTNWKLQVLAPAGGRTIAMMNGKYFTERGYAAPFLSTGVHYDIQAPQTVFAGQSFWITVIVLDVSGTTKSDYCGITSFTSTDPNAKIQATAMDSYNFTWNSTTACPGGTNPNGVMMFFNVTLNRLGVIAITANDVSDGSITGITAVTVVGADIKLVKRPPLQVAASGDTVSFKICWSNYSSASGFSFVINDAIPIGTTYVPDVPSMMDCGNTDGVALTVAYSTVAQATIPAAASFTAAGAGGPPANTTWLRWTVPTAGVGTTGCACFRVSVN